MVDANIMLMYLFIITCLSDSKSNKWV